MGAVRPGYWTVWSYCDATMTPSDALTQLFLGVLTLFVFLKQTSSHSHGHHEHHGEKPTGFHDPNVVQDRTHIKEHYEGQADINEENMTTEELEFHYFKLHDFDNNTMLDGLEIFKALTHLVPFEAEGKESKNPTEAEKEEQLKYYTDIIDSVLEEDDINNDGYLTYIEFVLARQREEQRNKQQEKTGEPQKL